MESGSGGGRKSHCSEILYLQRDLASNEELSPEDEEAWAEAEKIAEEKVERNDDSCIPRTKK